MHIQKYAKYVKYIKVPCSFEKKRRSYLDSFNRNKYIFAGNSIAKFYHNINIIIIFT
jgi:hypothetical protein